MKLVLATTLACVASCAGTPVQLVDASIQVTADRGVADAQGSDARDSSPGTDGSMLDATARDGSSEDLVVGPSDVSFDSGSVDAPRDDASVADASFQDALPQCVSSPGGWRTCVCSGQVGQLVTYACAPSLETCYRYPTTCIDHGFLQCEEFYYNRFPGLESACRAFCDTQNRADGGMPRCVVP